MFTEKKISATEYSHKRGRYLDDAHAGAIIMIERNKRVAAVMLSKEYYDYLRHLEDLAEDYYWNCRADEAEKDILSRKEADELTKKLLTSVKE